MPKSKIIRQKAKATLDNKPFKSGWLWPLLILMIQSAVVSVLGSLSLVVSAVIGVASATYFMALARRTAEASNIKTYFHAFKYKIGSNIVLSVIQGLYLFLWSIIPFAGLIKRYSYAMTYYIKVENPNLTANEVITKSREMMLGYKWKLFCLDLSFIGWHLLDLITLGVASLWIAPYKAAAYAHFYDELKEIRAKEIIIE